MNLPSTIHLFTDGSCIHPQQPAIRLGSWGVCLARLPDLAFDPVAAGGVPGLYQTVLRSEILGAIAAFRFGLYHRREFYTWTDNELVVKRIKRYSVKGAVGPLAKHNDHDLWSRLHTLVQRAVAMGLFQTVIKVTSHQQQGLTDTVEEWARRGNDAADLTAAMGLQHLPGHITQLASNFAHTLHTRVAACKAFQSMLVQFGLRCVETKPKVADHDEQKWQKERTKESEGEDDISLSGIPRVLSEPESHKFGPCLEPLHSWLVRLTSVEDARPLWLSSYQLLLHFQGVTSLLGFEYKPKGRKWDLADDYVQSQGYDFLKIAGWLQTAIRGYAGLMGLKAEAKSRLPWGSTFRAWQRCLKIPASPAEFTKIDQVFRERGITGVKTVRTAFAGFEPCRGVLR